PALRKPAASEDFHDQAQVLENNSSSPLFSLDSYEARNPSLPLTATRLYQLAGSPLVGSESPEADSQSQISTGSESADGSEEPTMAEGSIRQIRRVLERNNIYIDNEEARHVGTALIQQAKTVLDQKRGSDWSSDKAAHKRLSIVKYSNENERTFLIKLLNTLVGDKRHVPDREMTQAERVECQNWIARDWETDELRCRWEADLAAEWLPELETTGDPFLDKLLEGVPRITKPRPDITWSIFKDAFDPVMQELFDQLKCDITGPEAYHTFLGLEGKCRERSIEEAILQSARTGMGLVNNSLRFHRALTLALASNRQTHPDAQQATQDPQRQAKIQLQHQQKQALARQNQSVQPAYPSPSTQSPSPLPANHLTPSSAYPLHGATLSHEVHLESFVFTLAVAADQAKMYVNWVLIERPSNIPKWQMHRLRNYTFDEADQIAQLHHDIDNVLDWGAGLRKRRIEEKTRRCIEYGVVPTLDISIKKRKRDKG
ncbi:MAG: hypothetical protein Q9163_006405, partial [Psora crenata]